MRREHDRRAGQQARADADHPAPGSCSCPTRADECRYGAYRVPQPAACDLEDARYRHDDVAQLEEVQLEAELAALVALLASLPAAARPLDRAWLLERRRRLRAAPAGRVQEGAQPATNEPDEDALMARALGVTGR